MSFRPNALRLTIFAAAVASVALVTTGGAPLAQTAQAPNPTTEKIEQLFELLDDPDVRAGLEAARTPFSDSPALAAASQIAAWENDIRGHLILIYKVVPRIPSEAANAIRLVQTQINHHGFGTVLILFTGLLALGFGPSG